MTRRLPLSEEDRILWNMVAQTTAPLKGRPHPQLQFPGQSEPGPPPPSILPVVDRPSPAPPRQPIVARSIDAPVREKLAKGRVELGGRVDLHGMTQDEAYFLLLGFLRTAHERGLRYVLVITGKGSSSAGDGVLRRSVPGWFATAPFRSFVSGYDEAARNHGGAGAIYVRLRRRTAP
ncbi:MAG: Smr/MutS family protein [Rhizobiaceae bacterium]